VALGVYKGNSKSLTTKDNLSGYTGNPQRNPTIFLSIRKGREAQNLSARLRKIVKRNQEQLAPAVEGKKRKCGDEASVRGR